MFFDSGQLRHRITFVRNGETENELGQTVVQDVELKKVWAKVEVKKTYNKSEEERLRDETAYNIITRYHKGIDVNMYILFKDKRLRINQIVNVDERNYCLKITATAIEKENGKK